LTEKISLLDGELVSLGITLRPKRPDVRGLLDGALEEISRAVFVREGASL
jgi:hypothetical protein